MGWFPQIPHSFRRKSASPRPASRQVRLKVEILEERQLLSTASLSSGILTVTGNPVAPDRLLVSLQGNNLLVQDSGVLIGQFANSSVTHIDITTGNGEDRAQIAPQVMQPAIIVGGTGKDILIAGGGPTTISGGGSGSTLSGGSGTSTFAGGTGSQLIVGGTGANTGTTGTGPTKVIQVTAANTILTKPTDQVLVNNPDPASLAPTDANTVLTTAQVQQLIQRAMAANANNGAIIAVVDRNGNILGVNVENGVSTAITGNTANLVFSVDGAVSLARTGAFFSSDQGALTSRLVGNLSQSTITQREVDSSPDIANPNSTLFGPGFVAPIEIGGHFPPGIANTPEVDLFGIENTNRDSLLQTGANGNRFDTATDIKLPARFNINPNYVPAGQTIYAPESYGYVSGLMPDAQSRGIATLPGGFPIYKNGILVGGIGVFFPGTTGYASAENSSLSAGFNPNKPDLSYEAEYMGFAALGGIPTEAAVGALAGIAPLPGISVAPLIQIGKNINLNGITLDAFGPVGGLTGIQELYAFGKTLGTGSPTAGTFKQVTTNAKTLFATGVPVPSGWLVVPHNGVGITAAQVKQMIVDGIAQANLTRSAIRLPLNTTAKMIFAVTDEDGNVVGLYRMPDAPVFSIGVAVAKARNTAYYNNPVELQPVDQLPGVAPGVAFTNRTFRFLALPRYPSGAPASAPGFFSILNDGGVDPNTGLNVGPPLPPSAFQSVLGYDAFHPDTNFRDPFNVANQNGVVFFPGSSGVYVPTASGGATLIGGLGVSGDGVSEDDVITAASAAGYGPMNGIIRADQIKFRGVALPYMNFSRNPDVTS
jgi:uncharacterized protein GlcG (DUF336 family)